MAGMGTSNLCACSCFLVNSSKNANKLLGIFSFCNDANTPGLAFAAAHPQTEFIAIMEVPDLIKFLISSSFLSSEKPLLR